MKSYLITVAISLAVGAAGGWKLHPSGPPPKSTSENKNVDKSTTTGPTHTEVVEFSNCPPCQSCNGQAAPIPTPRPAAPRASKPTGGGLIVVPPALLALLQPNRTEPESNLWTTLPPEDPAAPRITRLTVTDQGPSTTEIKSSDIQTSKETAPSLPKWLVGLEVIDPITSRQFLVRGGHRIFDTNLFATGSFMPSTKDWSVGAEVHF